MNDEKQVVHRTTLYNHFLAGLAVGLAGSAWYLHHLASTLPPLRQNDSLTGEVLGNPHHYKNLMYAALAFPVLCPIAAVLLFRWRGALRWLDSSNPKTAMETCVALLLSLPISGFLCLGGIIGIMMKLSPD